MDAAVQPAHTGLLRSLVKRFELTNRQPQYQLRRIRESIIITEKMGERGGSGSRNYTVAARKFREGRCLDNWVPVLINIFFNIGFGPDVYVFVFGVPATDKAIGQPSRYQNIRFGGLHHI